MAENDIMGAIMSIPDSILPKLDEMDKKLERIAVSSENTSKTMVQAFDAMKNGGTSLLELLTNISNKTAELGNSSANVDRLGQSFQKANTEAQSMASSVTQAADNLNKMGTGTTPTTHLEQLKSQLNDIDSEFNKLRETQAAFDNQGKLTDTARGLAAKRSAIAEEVNLYSQSADKIANLEDKKASAAEKAAARQAAAAQKAAAEQDKAAERERIANLSTYSGATSFAGNATSINERIQAIKYLTAARANLSITDNDYNNKLQTLNSSIKQMNAANQQAIASSKELQTTHRNLIDTAGQLARQFALIFSISQIQGYMSKMVEVRGMFELQQVALEAILQNKTQADEIFQKTVDLAVQSPFRIKELITYTKELAAFRIEGSKLYDTTKMLADVSAGLGVDMNRLILAYGQVKAAAYLRGFDFMATLYGNIEDITPLIAGTPRKGQSAAKYAIAA